MLSLALYRVFCWLWLPVAMSVYENGINYGLRHERDVLRTFLRKMKKAANKRKREKKESPQEIRYRNAQHTKSKRAVEKKLTHISLASGYLFERHGQTQQKLTRCERAHTQQRDENVVAGDHHKQDLARVRARSLTLLIMN